MCLTESVSVKAYDIPLERVLELQKQITVQAQEPGQIIMEYCGLRGSHFYHFCFQDQKSCLCQPKVGYK